MASHVLDMLPIGNSFGTPEMRAVWSDEARLGAQLAVEGRWPAPRATWG